MNNKIYTTAPLPFMGQKRRFLNLFKQGLNEFSTASVFVDLFGGSGLLSHTTKRMRPDAMVVYNDYDDYHIRLLNIPRTNVMLKNIRNMVKDYPDATKLPNIVKWQIIDYVKGFEKTGFVDYITLSSSLLFAMKYVLNITELEKSTFYNTVKQTDYNATCYLEGLHVVKSDYKDLFDKYKNIPGAVFIVDPPYLSTEVGTYNNYWKLADYLDVLKVLKDNSYFYFTSNKSSILELCDWLEINLEANNPFTSSVRYEMPVKVNHNAGYTDIMLYKNVSCTGTLIDSCYVSDIA